MRRRTWVTIASIAAVIVAAVIVAVAVRGGALLTEPKGPSSDSSATSESPVPEPTTEPSEVPSGEPSPTAQAATPGAYVGYSDTAVAAAQGRILLFFHADWCPQCRALEDDILTRGVPDGVTFIVVDYDSRQDLRQRYGITLQTTLVEVDSSGSELQRHIAYGEPTLAAVAAAMLGG